MPPLALEVWSVLSVNDLGDASDRALLNSRSVGNSLAIQWLLPCNFDCALQSTLAFRVSEHTISGALLLVPTTDGTYGWFGETPLLPPSIVCPVALLTRSDCRYVSRQNSKV